MLNSETGILRGKTRILVTNALYMLPQVDTIVLLKNGSIECVGSYDSLLRESTTFHELIANYTSTNMEEDVETGVLNIEEEDILKELTDDNNAMVMMRTLSTSSSVTTVSVKKDRHMSVKSVLSQQKDKKNVEQSKEEIGKCNFLDITKS